MSEIRSDAGLIEVLDRVLDKGIVIDAFVKVSVVGVELISVDARVVVAAIETYLAHADAVAFTAPAARPLMMGLDVPPLFVEVAPAAAEAAPPVAADTPEIGAPAEADSPATDGSES